MTGLTVNDTITDTELSAFNKGVSDLQTGVTFGANAIKGTLKHITGWTEFSSVAEEQNGNYLVFKSTLTDADKITVQLIGAKSTRGAQELDADGIAIFRITDKDAQMVQVVAYKDGKVQQKLYSLRGLTLQEE